MFYYAYIERDICLEIVSSETEMNEDCFIPIESEDWSLVGKYWNGTEFIDPPFNITAEHSTDDICYKQEDKSLSQKLDEMDITVSEKAPISHSHTAEDVGASSVDHSHTGYSLEGHTHNEFAPLVHDHHGEYSHPSHTHTLESLGAAAANHSHNLADFAETSDKKIMTASERDKLGTIEENANNYSHPASHPASMITGLSAVATSGDFNDLINKPNIGDSYTHPSTHPASMITGLADVATSGSYEDLTDKPTVPGSLADLTGDATHRTVTDEEKSAWNAKSNFSGNYNDLINKPTIPTAYSHPATHPASMITGLSDVATTGSYNDLSDKPLIPTEYTHPGTHPASMITGLAGVATSGNYNDLTNKPAIPSSYTHPGTHPASMITGLANVATSGKYSDLEGTPTIPAAYTHPTYTAKSLGLYKVVVDGTGHVSGSTPVTKSDITALGIPSTNTTYSVASQTSAGLLSPSDKTKLDGIATGANKTTVDSALNASSTNPVQNKVINAALEGKAPLSHTHSNNVVVQQASSPYVRLSLTGSSMESRIYKNASATADYGTTIADYDSEGAKDSLIFCRGNALDKKIYLNVQNDDDSRSLYYLYGEHHKPTADEVGALATTGGTVNGNVTVNGDVAASGVLRVGGQQAFYFSSANSQVIGTNNATGGTHIGCGSSADMTLNGARIQIPSLLPRNGGTFQIGNTTNRFSGIYLVSQPNVSSDNRLKRDIASLDIDTLANFVKDLNVVDYNYTTDEKGSKKRIGLIAQEVVSANPEVAEYFVEQDSNGFYSMTPADLVFPLIATVQKLAREIEELKSR